MLRGKRGGVLLFVLIAALVAGGLGWVTHAALELETEQREGSQLRLALWRLDSRIAPVLAREDGRPYYHFSAVYAPALAMNKSGVVAQPGSVLEISPLVGAELPEWILFHFQADEQSGWTSPRVLSQSMCMRLNRLGCAIGSSKEESVLAQLSKRLPAKDLLGRLGPDVQPRVDENAAVLLASQLQQQQQELTANNMQPNQGAYPFQTDQQKQMNEKEYVNRFGQRGKVTQEVQQSNSNLAQNLEQNVALNNISFSGERWFMRDQLVPIKVPRGEQTPVKLGTMSPLWTEEGDYLILARRVSVGDKKICQGLLLDWTKLQKVLAEEVADLYPDAHFVAMRDELPANPERTMTALPIELVPGLAASEAPFWTPLRVGLAMSWLAALVALAAVGLGGWSLLELSERRIGFVSAVTHELRTPMTTLRLYLDMLSGGMVKEEKQKTEYLHTLNEEADRLDRLIGNVLDFSRLERQKPSLEQSPQEVQHMLEQVQSSWQGRCASLEKELLIDNQLPEGAQVTTDARIVQQILSSLVDNACKYSRGAEDRRIWLRARRVGSQVVLEVEDRGPGVAKQERRTIFRPFRRGRGTETTGGVGLGLALAQRWARLLNGTLAVAPAGEQPGACFQLSLPAA